MAAPTTSARIAPTGIKLDDGFSTTISFARKTNINLWEKTVKPPGLDGGEKIEQTTMLNIAYRTFTARALKTVTDCTFNAQYDPGVYTDILALINLEGSVTIHFPDGSTYDFYGYLGKFEPAELQEGSPPMAACTIFPTNYDPTNKVEAAPVLTSVTGT